MGKQPVNFVHKILLAVVVVVLLLLFLHRPIGRQRTTTNDSGMIPVMGTIAQIIAVAQDGDSAPEAMQEAVVALRDVDSKMSVYIEDSEISQLNRSMAKKPVQISAMSYDVIHLSRDISRISEGAFDITVAPLIELFRTAADVNRLPTAEQIETARSRTGFRDLILDAQNQTVAFAKEGMKIDLGGIAKGYAIDRAIEKLQQQGVSGGLVNVGGDIRCFGTAPEENEFWSIGLQDPFHAEDVSAPVNLLSLKVQDVAVTTSGNYRRAMAIEGRQFNHIFNTDSGASAEELASVTMIAPTAVEADGFATAVSVLGLRRGLALVESRPELDAILIPADQTQRKLVLSSGAGKYVGRTELEGYEVVHFKTLEREWQQEGLFKRYTISRVSDPPVLQGNWEGDIWGGIESVALDYAMPPAPGKKPKVKCKLAYDAENLYCIFRVEDHSVLAKCTEHQQYVCGDSCVEFFFTPGPDRSEGYFNLEMNCGGTMYFAHQKARDIDVVKIALEDLLQIKVFHTQPKIVKPEMKEPVTWIVEYKLPLHILEKYAPVEKPASGVIWYANFYKCADSSSNPHWLTWSKVDWSRPAFHMPQFFGTLEFD